MNIDERPCPFCAEPIKAAATICRHCKSNLPGPQAYAAPPMPTRKGMPGWAIALIVCVAIIPVAAVVAAIAIPALLTTQRASNERNASLSLKTIATAQADFRSNDRDHNRVNDFWTGDIAGLYCIDDTSTGRGFASPIKLIEVSVALADIQGETAKGCTLPRGDDNYSTPITTFGVPSAKAGYWYMALVEDRGAPAGSRIYRQNTGGAEESNHNTSRFGAAALPEVYGSSGRFAYIICESNTVYKRDFGSEVLSGTLPPALTGRFDGNWPSDSDLRSQWSKMD